MSLFTRLMRTSPALAAAALTGLAAASMWGCVDDGTNREPRYKATVLGEGASGGGSYKEGDTVAIKAGAAPDGERFRKWTSSNGGVAFADSNSAATTFIMPAYAVTVAAVFEPVVFVDDRDGRPYKTTRIGGKVWLAQNLNYKLPAGGSWCYGNVDSNCDSLNYGRLYLWSTAMAGSASSKESPSGVQGVCPEGWHLPSRLEWGELALAAGGAGEYGADPSSKAGLRLKAQSDDWRAYQGDHGDGTDDFGFAALPSGVRDNESANFTSVGFSARWWTATEFNNISAYQRRVDNSYDYLDESNESKSRFGYAVRCVRND